LIILTLVVIAIISVFCACIWICVRQFTGGDEADQDEPNEAQGSEVAQSAASSLAPSSLAPSSLAPSSIAKTEIQSEPESLVARYGIVLRFLAFYLLFPFQLEPISANYKPAFFTYYRPYQRPETSEARSERITKKVCVQLF